MQSSFPRVSQGFEERNRSPPTVCIQYKGWRASEMWHISKTNTGREAYAEQRAAVQRDLKTLGIGQIPELNLEIEFVWGSGKARCRWHGPTTWTKVSIIATVQQAFVLKY